MQGVIIQFVYTSPGEYHDVDSGKAVLLEADGFANKSFQPVAIHGPSHVLLAEDQADARMAQCVGACQCQQSFAVNLERRVIEDVSVLPGIQQSQMPGETMTGHTQAEFRRSDACGPWRDDAPARRGHSW